MVYATGGPLVDSSQSMPSSFCTLESWHDSLWKMRPARFGDLPLSIHEHTHGPQCSWQGNRHAALALKDSIGSRVTINRWDF